MHVVPARVHGSPVAVNCWADKCNCCADARPPFTCNFMMIFLGPDRNPSIGSPRVAALQAGKVRGGAI